MFERVVDLLLLAVSWTRRRQRRDPAFSRINLGSGPVWVAAGWVNVDASAHLLVRWLPGPALRAVLARTSVGSRAAAPLKESRFVYHDLRHGIPFPDESATAVYTSHVLEHLEADDALRVMREARRVLRPCGVGRVVVPEARDDDPHEATERLFDRHRTQFTTARLTEMLTAAGFTRVRVCAYREGECPDIDVLDNRPASIFMEAS